MNIVARSRRRLVRIAVPTLVFAAVAMVATPAFARGLGWS
jgi:hypothetical protein